MSKKEEISIEVDECSCVSIITIIMGLPMLCMGYYTYFNINGYILVDATITENSHATFEYDNHQHKCKILFTSFDSKTSFHFYHPVGSNTTLLYDSKTNGCRTINMGTNLFIAGTFFTCMSIVAMIIGCIMRSKKVQQIQNISSAPSMSHQDNVITGNVVEAVKLYEP
jgi:hypothetical protein